MPPARGGVTVQVVDGHETPVARPVGDDPVVAAESDRGVVDLARREPPALEQRLRHLIVGDAGGPGLHRQNLERTPARELNRARH